jgi:HD-GYP domain-containing protein (c-di-GMP phosphodiesterase class II)
VPGLGTIADAVRSSHERFDGTGYPDGLAGEAIPRVARIVAVCDGWHALTSDRPQRARLASPEALELLRSLAGTALDPEIVGALCEVLGTHADRALRHAS